MNTAREKFKELLDQIPKEKLEEFKQQHDLIVSLDSYPKHGEIVQNRDLGDEDNPIVYIGDVF